MPFLSSRSSKLSKEHNHHFGVTAAHAERQRHANDLRERQDYRVRLDGDIKDTHFANVRENHLRAKHNELEQGTASKEDKDIVMRHREKCSGLREGPK
jgi:hypothetical protein